MKKILILTVTAGNGHNSAANGMKEKLLTYDNVEVKVIDLLKKYSTKLNAWVTDSGYSMAIGKLPHIYDMFFKHFQKRNPNKRYTASPQATCISTTEGLLKDIYEFKPDVIYCTHFYCAIALNNLRLAYDIPCKIVFCCLDYVVYPFLECAIGIDYITLPTTDFIEDIKKDGFKDSQILCTGLPVKEQFNQVVEKSYARKQLNIDENLFTIMVIFGGGHWSGGFKIFKDVISCLKDVNAQIIMINGKNKSSFNKIAKMKFPTNIKVVNVGFTNQVDLYMSASDIVISKLGGQGGTEIINKLRPIVVTDKVYGQELCNLKYLKQYGIVQDFKNKTQLKQIVTKLMNDTQFYNNIVEQEKKFKNDALNTIAEKMLSFENAIYKDLDIDYSKVKSNVKKAIKKAKRNK